jgi:ribose transport system substrate-binding protein
MKRYVLTAAATAAIAPCLAACGSSSSNNATASPGGTSTTASAASSGVAAARAAVAAMRKPPQPLNIPALAKKPASGRTAYWLSCKLPECDAGDPGFVAATKALGWHLTTLKMDLSPESVAAAWTRAVTAKPDVIFAVGLVPDQLIKAQLAQAQADGTKVVMVADNGGTVGEYGIDASIASTRWYDADGAGLADWAIADSGGKASILFLYDPSIVPQASAYRAVKDEAAKNCAGCKVDGLPIQSAQAGKVIPGQVLSYVQKHPDVKYVLTILSSNALGVGQALKSAGLSVKVGTSDSQPQNLDAVSKGVEAVAMPNELSSLAWRMTDAAVRLTERVPLPHDLAEPIGARQLFDRSNIAGADLKQPWDVPDVAQTFTRAWKLG